MWPGSENAIKTIGNGGIKGVRQWKYKGANEVRYDEKIFGVGHGGGRALAAACSLHSRDESGPQLCFQLLVYPVTNCRMETASMQKHTDSPPWNAGLNRMLSSETIAPQHFPKKHFCNSEP